MKSSVRLPASLAAAAAALLLTSASLAVFAKGQLPNHRRPEPANACADRCDAVVIDWSAAAVQVIEAADGYADPMAASRALAMMHLAMHDAVNAVRPRYRRYALDTLPASAGEADATVAAAVAAHDVLAGLYPQPAATTRLKAQLARTLFEAGVGATVEAGKATGHAAAAAVLAKRAHDGSRAFEAYSEGSRPGEYRYTAPFDFAAAPHWRNLEPFALASAAQFRTAPPPALDSEDYRRAFEEVRRVGGKHAGAERSADETHYASFWYEFSDMGWNRIARTVANRVPQDLWDRARTFALLNVAMADAYIAGWDSKYFHNFWRPVTAIHLAADDGNPHTAPNPGFEPLLVSPPVPDMPSTHSALGMAAAVVLTDAFGAGRAFRFASSSALPAHPARSFASFEVAALENGDSRVKGGLHFRFAVDAGLKLGRQVGEHVIDEALPRLPDAKVRVAVRK